MIVKIRMPGFDQGLPVCARDFQGVRCAPAGSAVLPMHRSSDISKAPSWSPDAVSPETCTRRTSWSYLIALHSSVTTGNASSSGSQGLDLLLAFTSVVGTSLSGFARSGFVRLVLGHKKRGMTVAYSGVVKRSCQIRKEKRLTFEPRSRLSRLRYMKLA